MAAIAAGRERLGRALDFGADRFGIDQADRMLDRLEEQFRLLAAQPRSGRVCAALQSKATSSFTGSHPLVYGSSGYGMDGQDPSRLKSEL